MVRNGGIGPLLRLARMRGLYIAYDDQKGRRQRALPEALLSVLRVLGEPLERTEDAPDALRERHRARWREVMEPVAVAWGRGVERAEVRLPLARADGTARCKLALEDGEVRLWTVGLAALPPVRGETVDGTAYVAKLLDLPRGLPLGYHHLAVQVGRLGAETLLIRAPVRAYQPPAGDHGKAWGLFAPVYALRSQHDLGMGDFTDLEALTRWVEGLGGQYIATLPMLATFLDGPTFDPSPYAPASRLFWNEAFLDVQRLSEPGRYPALRAALDAPEVRAEVEVQRAEALVDYRRQAVLKRRLLGMLAACFFDGPEQGRERFHEFLVRRPEARDYAAFRATVETRGQPWPAWPERLRAGALQSGDYDPALARYHEFAQWLAHEEVSASAARARGGGHGLYLDLPVGTHPDGYDVWREREAYAVGASTGAPPDALFIKGQNWGFPPLHPDGSRRQGHRHFIAYIRHHLRHAGMLRIDHVMGLHRLYWVPPGFTATQGIYVRNPAEELYAILCLESHKNKTMLVGEDLGTVPGYVRETMTAHGLHRMYVLQFAMRDDPNDALAPVPASSVASVNTHDMPPFASFWEGLDADDRVDLGLISREEADGEKWGRGRMRWAVTQYLRAKGLIHSDNPTPQEALVGCLRYMAASPARVALVNVEDLWGETRQQNTPGTTTERPNWRRKVRLSIEELAGSAEITGALRDVAALRRRADD